MTLTELLVAVFIAAIVILLAVTGYRMLTTTLDRQVRATEGLDAALAAVEHLRTDIRSLHVGPDDSECAFTLELADPGETRIWTLRACVRRMTEGEQDPRWNEVRRVRYWTERDPDRSFALYRAEQPSGNPAEGSAETFTNLLIRKAESIQCMAEFRGDWLTVWPAEKSEPGRPPGLLRIVIEPSGQNEDAQPVQADLFVPVGLTVPAP